MRCQELPFFYVDRLAGLGRCPDEVGLTAQKRRCLQHINHRRYSGDLIFCVHICEHGKLQFALDLGQYRQALDHARATKGRSAGSVGLVKAALENKGDAQARGDLLERTRGIHLQLFGLNDTGPGNQKKRLPAAHLKTAKFHQATALRFLPPLRCSSEALMKALNSGCPFQGVDLNSG